MDYHSLNFYWWLFFVHVVCASKGSALLNNAFFSELTSTSLISVMFAMSVILSYALFCCCSFVSILFIFCSCLNFLALIVYAGYYWPLVLFLPCCLLCSNYHCFMHIEEMVFFLIRLMKTEAIFIHDSK